MHAIALLRRAGAPASAAALALAAALAAAQDMRSAADAAPAVVPDPAWFRDRVLPVLAQRCLGCHDAADPANDTRHRLVAPRADGTFDDAAVRRNYETARTFLDARTPERSPYLLKLVPVARGGVDHDGGKADDVELPAALVAPRGPLVAWAFGGTAADAPPVAAWAPLPRQVAVGDEVRLDASLSFDPDGRPVTVRWEVADAPQGARAKPEDAAAATTRIVPDREGPWTLRLRVEDGKLRGWPGLLRFAAVRKAAPDGAPPTAPSTPLGAADVDAATRRATRLLYLELWGRTPTDEELARSAALPWPARVDALLDTDETWRNWLEDECFYLLLVDQFRPVSDRVAALPAELRAGRVSPRDAHRTIALSSEFNARNPGNDTYCTVVLEQFVGVEVQKNVRLLEAAKAAYDGKPQKVFDVPVRNQSDVVHAALAQRAATDLFARRMEERYLRAPLPKAEHDAVVGILHGSPLLFRDVLRDWLVSERCAGPARPPRRKNDLQFVRSLFVDLLGRPPTYEEFRNLRNALQALADPTPLRGVLAKVLLDSSAVLPPPDPAPAADERYPGERFRPVVADLFRRLLGRDPSREEAAAFCDVLREPGATWRTAALAILSSPQYQYY